MIGQRLGHYKIVDKLGEGGMGEVYLAEDTRLRRQVALKVLPVELATSEDRLERFQREAQTLAAIDHPNIVHIYSVESDREVHFLTMQLIRGQCLSELISRDGLPVDRILAIATPMVDALRAAHEKGIIHRDLKPENVMVDEEGRVKILDFGLAKLRLPEADEGDSQLSTQAMTQAGVVMGTVPYMSPEQVQGSPVDHRTDIFSLGIILYEMACGVRPFQGENSASLISSLMRDDPVPIAEVKPGLPQRLVDVIDRCLEKDREQRYASTGELHTELVGLQNEIAAGQAVVARPEGEKAGPGHGSRIFVAAILVLTILAGVIWLARKNFGEPPPLVSEGPQISSIAVMPLKNLSGDPEQDYFVDGMTEALITDLSKIGALKVISRSSSMRFKESDKPISEIAQELDVDAVIEGSVVREGNRVGITAQLIDVATETNIWADRYERELSSILTLQGEIAQAIAQGIEVSLTLEEQTLFAVSREIDPQAHEAYLKGMFHLYRYTPQDFQTALQYFDAALAIDPEYAPIHAGIAKVWTFASQFGVLAPSEANAKQVEPLRKALELDDSQADAHLTSAIAKTWYEWDWEGGEREFRRAIELNPNNAEAHVFYAHFLSLLGRFEEGTAQMERALELDPLNPFYQGLHGIQLMMVGRIDEAIIRLQTTLENNPGFGFGRKWLASLLHLKGRDDEGLVQLRTHFQEIGDLEAIEAIDRGSAEGGYQQAAKVAADLLVRRAEESYVAPLEISVLYEDADEVQKALDWLEKGYEVRDPDMPYIGAAPHSKGYASDPRFKEMVRKLDLPFAWESYPLEAPAVSP